MHITDRPVIIQLDVKKLPDRSMDGAYFDGLETKFLKGYRLIRFGFDLRSLLLEAIVLKSISVKLPEAGSIIEMPRDPRQRANLSVGSLSERRFDLGNGIRVFHEETHSTTGTGKYFHVPRDFYVLSPVSSAPPRELILAFEFRTKSQVETTVTELAWRVLED